MIESLCFYLFAAITVLSGFMGIASCNPVHSVLFLILAFFNSAGLFVLLGAEFLAMILVIVYVGAVAVLFLFVVMMLDIDFVELRQGFLQYLPMGALIGLILVVELMMVFGGWVLAPEMTAVVASATPDIAETENTRALGQLIYTDYVFLFQCAGMVLLTAMIGAIVLTHRQRPGVKRQNISKQVRRRRDEAYELVDIKPGQGV